MSEKKLLNENTIRRFMKLANVEPLTNSFLREMSTDYGDPSRDDDEFDSEQEGEEEAMEMDVDMGDIEDAPAAEEDPEAAPVIDPDLMADEDGLVLTEPEATLIADLGDRIRKALAVDSDEAPEEDPELEPEVDMGELEPEAAGSEDMPGAPGPEEEEEEEEAAMQENLVHEVLKRVTQRIVREKIARK
jgi:hypothetical protein